MPPDPASAACSPGLRALDPRLVDLAREALGPLSVDHPLVELFFAAGTGVRLAPRARPRVEERRGVQVRAVGPDSALSRWTSRADGAGVKAACADWWPVGLPAPEWRLELPGFTPAELRAWGEALEALDEVEPPSTIFLSAWLELRREHRGAVFADQGAARASTEVDLVVEGRLAGGGSLDRRFRLPIAPDPACLVTHLSTVAEEAAALCRAERAGAFAVSMVGTSPQATATLVHELVGHALEADHLLAGASPFAGAERGMAISCSELWVADRPDQGPGALPCDDEGVMAGAVSLVEAGCLAGVLHDRATAMACDAAPSGCGRREDHRQGPAPRMRGLVVSAGPHAAMDLRGEAGLWIERVREARSALADGRFFAEVERAVLIRRGEAPRSIRDLVIGGGIREVLAGLVALGDDLVHLPEAVRCAKGGVVTVGHAAPSALWRGLELRS